MGLKAGNEKSLAQHFHLFGHLIVTELLLSNIVGSLYVDLDQEVFIASDVFQTNLDFLQAAQKDVFKLVIQILHQVARLLQEILYPTFLHYLRLHSLRIHTY